MARILPNVSQIWILSLMFRIFINTTPYHWSDTSLHLPLAVVLPGSSEDLLFASCESTRSWLEQSSGFELESSDFATYPWKPNRLIIIFLSWCHHSSTVDIIVNGLKYISHCNWKTVGGRLLAAGEALSVADPITAIRVGVVIWRDDVNVNELKYFMIQLKNYMMETSYWLRGRPVMIGNPITVIRTGVRI